MLSTDSPPELVPLAEIADSGVVPATVVHESDGVLDAIVISPPLVPSGPVITTIYRTKSWPVWLWHSTWWLGEQVFGWFCLMIGLALLATIPLAQFGSLGYLLECSGRIAKSGRLRDGLIDLDKWARLGGLVLGTYAMLLPLRWLAGFANDAALLGLAGQPNPNAQAWRAGLIALTVLMVGHILLAWYSGGKLRHFFWPLLAPFSLAHWVITRKVVGPVVRPAIVWLSPKLADDLYQPAPLTSWFPPAILLSALGTGPARMYVQSRDAVWDFTLSLHLPRYFWLGLRGFAGAFLWLFLPVLLLIGATKIENDGGALLVGLTGALLLATVLLYLPFLQAHFAAENRFKAMVELGVIRKLFLKAPIAFWFALLITLALALPPYLFKIQKVYEEFDWAMSLFFVFLVYPGRLLAGWAVGLANHREKAGFFLFRWSSRLAAIPVCLTYVLFVYLSQYTSWFGSWSLFEQHPFLVPAPFFGG